ncbi:uncharacterized protein LOC110979277 [Acanthaster planci]|uniref:Uncharacterized protein LOC110979277 n=1 Tax=Acanthaster planci TaxID=133434 RepID=A0A8B7YBK0_ACAPL|nr:uncharacterized protein LOC110979277 [Acanthaster planci]
MNEAHVNKIPENNTMDIVSMAFSNVSERSDLIEVSSSVSPTTEDAEAGNNASAAESVRCEDGNQIVDVHQSDQVKNRPSPIEIPLPPNAIISVNDQGEQTIELAQVAGDDHQAPDMPDQTCSIEHVEQIEQVETVVHPDEHQPGPAGDVVPMSVGGDGLEAIAFQGTDVGMIGDETCVVPVTISLTDVQNLQQVVGGVHIGPSGESVQVSSTNVAVTSSTPGLSESASSLFSSLASIIDTSSVLTTANMSSASLPASGVTFVSGAGIPLPTVQSLSRSAEAQPPGLCASGAGITSAHSESSTSNGSGARASSAAQFIHNGTTLQKVNFSDGSFLTQKSQLMNAKQTTGVGAQSTDQVGSLPPVQKQDSANIIGNRSVFSPMTLTIRTPPGAPAVNQALINSIVNNAEVQALLKRNPGQPITIVRVPEDPSEKRQHLPGMVTAKVLTNRSPGGGGVPHRQIGRPRKEPGTDEDAKGFPVRRRGRQPGTKIRRKEEDYVPPVSWQPVKSRTRSGRLSRPPGYRTENFKMLYPLERPDNPSSDAEGGSDMEADSGSSVAFTPSGRVKNFKCRSCSKAYIGRGGLARHFLVEPTHGNIDDYALSEGSGAKLDGSTAGDVQNTSNELADSEINNKDVAEESAESPQSLAKDEGEHSRLLKEDVMDLDEEPVTDKATGEPAEEPPPEQPSRGRRGRPPNANKDDPDFRPGTSANKGSVKSKDKRKETMRQALKFLNQEDYMDVCLPRMARHLSPWDFLVSKAEILKEDTPQVLKVLQLFEELLSDVREMAVNCLEKVEDEDEEMGGLYLDEDDDLARVLEFDKGWYKVSAPPAGAAELPFSVSSLLKRTAEAISKDDFTDEDATPVKLRKVEPEEPDMTNNTVQNQVSSQVKSTPKPGPTSDPKSITVHVHNGKVTTEQGSPSIAALRAPLRETVPLSSTDRRLASAENTTDQQQTDSEKLPSSTTLVPNQTSNSVIRRDPPPLALLALEQQPLAPVVLEQQPLNPTDPRKQSAVATEDSPAKEQIAGNGGLPQAQTRSPMALGSPVDAEASPPQDTSAGSAGEQSLAWEGEGQPTSSDGGTQFVHVAEELESLASTADVVNQSDMKVDPTDTVHQQETSVVVPEGSTIMQMQDGTFLVQKPDGTAMQIHTPEGMTIETVQELLSMEAGQ